MNAKERIVVFEDGADLLRETVVREPRPMLALMPMFEAVGPGRGAWEEAQRVEAEYLPPARRAA